jgi:hypothetical protein
MTEETNIPPKSKVRLPATIKKLRKRLKRKKSKGAKGQSAGKD